MPVLRFWRVVPLLTAVLALSSCPVAHAKKERTRYVELQPMVGYSWVNLTGFSDDNFTITEEDVVAAGGDANQVANDILRDGQVFASGRGPSVGAALQLKLWVFVLGARYTYTRTQDFGVHLIGGDLGLRLGKTVSLYGRLGPGFAFQDGLPDGMNTSGFAVSGAGGLEIRVAQPISIGFGLDADLLLMARAHQFGAGRDALSGNATLQGLQELDGSAVGYVLRPQLHFIWHL